MKGLSLGGVSEYDVVVTGLCLSGQKTACTAVITVNPIVVITGDTVGVRQPPGEKTDGITLDFVRRPRAQHSASRCRWNIFKLVRQRSDARGGAEGGPQQPRSPRQ